MFLFPIFFFLYFQPGGFGNMRRSKSGCTSIAYAILTNLFSRCYWRFERMLYVLRVASLKKKENEKSQRKKFNSWTIAAHEKFPTLFLKFHDERNFKIWISVGYLKYVYISLYNSFILVEKTMNFSSYKKKYIYI